MKKSLYIITLAALAMLVTSCNTSKFTKGEQYAKLYEEKPVTLLVMPPINKTTNVGAKELLFTSVTEPLIEAGYYVIPPMMAMQVFRNESAYDSEMFFDMPLGKFKEYFGADAAVFPIIEKWEKFLTTVQTTITYVVKSTTTNEVLFERTCEFTLDKSSYKSNGGLIGTIANIAANSVEAIFTEQIEAARMANDEIFKDFPVGKYHPRYMMDMNDKAQNKFVRVAINKY